LHRRFSPRRCVRAPRPPTLAKAAPHSEAVASERLTADRSVGSSNTCASAVADGQRGTSQPETGRPQPLVILSQMSFSRRSLQGQDAALIRARRSASGPRTADPTAERHFVLGTPIHPPFPDGFARAIVGMGCFWGAERDFWQASGVYTTAVGYTGGFTPNPTYEEVCSGSTGHTEAVLVVFDPPAIFLRADSAHLLGAPRPDAEHASGRRCRHPVPLRRLLRLTAPGGEIRATRDAYAAELAARGYGEITTEIAPAGPFYYAEAYHRAVPREEPGRLLRSRRHRRQLPDRARRQLARPSVAAATDIYSGVSPASRLGARCGGSAAARERRARSSPYRTGGREMAYAVVHQFAGGTEDQYNASLAAGASTGRPPRGDRRNTSPDRRPTAG